jgi:hypothetical protein
LIHPVRLKHFRRVSREKHLEFDATARSDVNDLGETGQVCNCSGELVDRLLPNDGRIIIVPVNFWKTPRLAAG